MKSDRVAVRSDGLSWRQIDDEIVVLDNRSGTYLSLNGSGAALWPLLVAGTTHDVLAASLHKAFGVPLEQAAADVTAFLADLGQNGLLA